MQILLLLIFFSYFFAPFSVTTISGYGITPLDVVMVFFYLYFFKQVFWNGVKLRFTMNPAFIALICLFIAGIFSSINPLADGSSKMIFQYFKTSIHFLFMIGFSIIACVYPIEPKKWSNVVRLWLILGFIINIFGVYQIIARAYDLPLAWIQYTNINLYGREADVQVFDLQQLSLRYGDFFRATSIFSEPSALAAFNIFMLIFTLIPFIQRKPQFFKSRFVSGMFIVMSIVSLLLTFSMTGAVGFFMVFIAAIIFERSKGLKTILKTLALSTLIIIVADMGVTFYTNISVIELFQRRIEGLVHYGSRDIEKDVTPGESAGQRLGTAASSLKIWQDYPITGIGLGLTSQNKKYQIGFSDFSVLAALAEMGLIGCLSFTGMFITIMLICLKFLRKREIWAHLSMDQQRLMGMLLYLMILEFEINFITGNNLINIGLWIPIAMVFSTINYSNINSDKKIISVSFIKTPLKETFNKALVKYSEVKEDFNKQ